MRKMWIVMLMVAPCLFANGDERNRKKVSGGIVTNVLSESRGVILPGEGSQHLVATTLDTVTGDLRGAIGVYFFSIIGVGIPQVVAKMHYHGVTEAGDTIFLQDATATAFQVGNLAGGLRSRR